MKTTPENIDTLQPNEIFVFGSNLHGNHLGGAAKLAQDKFGAQEGIGEGLTGQSYAFPTLGKDMQKVSFEDLKTSKEKLYKCAIENKDKTFLVTKVGCGIAGFLEEEMKDVFIGHKPDNVILPNGWFRVKGFKAMSEDMKCRDFQFELGKEYKHEGEIKLCGSGFHFCENLADVYEYYPMEESTIVCEVIAFGDVIKEEGGNKSVTNNIKIVRMLGNPERRANVNDSNSGYSNSGNWNSGYWNSGNSNSGYSNSGYSNSGDRNSGDWNSGNWNSGYFNIDTPNEIMVFGKMCKRTVWDGANKPTFLYFDLTKWISFEDMTEKEKEAYPKSSTTGGYLKMFDYKEAFQESFKKASKEDIKLLKALPNFDADVFYQISGIRV